MEGPKNPDSLLQVGLEGRSWIRRNVEYICSQCDLTIKSHSDLLNHMTSEHQDAIIIQKELPCSKCPLVFHTKASRSEHMEVTNTLNQLQILIFQCFSHRCTKLMKNPHLQLVILVATWAAMRAT